MNIYIYICRALLWRRFNFAQLPVFSVLWKASLSRVVGYSSLHCKASLSRKFECCFKDYICIDGYIYIQRSFGGCSTFLNYLSSPCIDRRHYREFLPSLKGVPVAKFWMFLERWNMYRWIYIYTPLVWRLFIFPQLVHWKALLPRIYRYSSLHWNAHLTRFLGYPSPHSKTSLSRKFG